MPLYPYVISNLKALSEIANALTINFVYNFILQFFNAWIIYM